MKILIVEDEPKTGDYLKQGLVEAGFNVDLVRDGMDGLHFGMTEAYDLIVLDVMLPGLDGWRVLQALRKAGKEMPVLFLTAKDSVDDRVKGLELGPTTIWSNPSPSRSCWLAFARSCAGGQEQGSRCLACGRPGTGPPAPARHAGGQADRSDRQGICPPRTPAAAAWEVLPRSLIASRCGT
jgi:CheY-like chemotaxis protein